MLRWPARGDDFFGEMCLPDEPSVMRPPSTRRLRNRMAAVASHLARSDQRHWAGELDGLATRLAR